VWIIRKGVWIIYNWDMRMSEVLPPPKRNKKRCKLTKQLGLAKLEAKIEKLQPEYQSDSGLAEFVQNLHRETIAKIRNQAAPVAFISLERLFFGLNLALEDHDWETCSGEPAVPRSDKPTQLPIGPAVRSLSQAQQVTELLWTLDCVHQEAAFKCAPHASNCSIFIVQASDLKLQKWLVKRFTRDYQNARKYRFVAPAHTMRWDFNGFWQDLSKALNTTTTTPDEVVERLCELAQTQPVFIAVYGLQGLEATRNHLLQDFWQPLSQKFCAQMPKSFRSKLVLFLTEESTASNPFSDRPDLSLLPPLTEILGNEVSQWLGRDDVYTLLSQTIEADYIESLVQSATFSWQTHPTNVLDQICFAFKLENGIADIESYWELAG
jgi:hypothetical protein